jgi:hypothetical protein
MIYELKNMRIKVREIDFLNDLNVVANRLGKKTLTQREYKNNEPKYSLNNAINRFGRWEDLLIKANLNTENSLRGIKYGEKKVRDEVLLNDIIRVSNELNKINLTCGEYDNNGKYTSTTIIARFGSWNNAKKILKLETTNIESIPNEELFQNLIDMWKLLGRQPKIGEMVLPNSKYHYTTYTRRFGSWVIALNTFITYVNSNNLNIEIETKKTPRKVNLSLRTKILNDDNFICKKCGCADLSELHIDHIIPWSKGGETIIDNLQTLCKKCNLHKSNSI